MGRVISAIVIHSPTMLCSKTEIQHRMLPTYDLFFSLLNLCLEELMEEKVQGVQYSLCSSLISLSGLL